MKDQDESGQRMSKNQGIVKGSKQIKGSGQKIERIKGSRWRIERIKGLRQKKSKDQDKENQRIKWRKIGKEKSDDQNEDRNQR